MDLARQALISAQVHAAGDALQFTFDRSSGPGGQNVNKVNTRVTLLFDFERAAGFSNEQRAHIRQRLATRLDRDGRLRIFAQTHRSQAANREASIERLIELLATALAPRKARRPTRVPRSAHRDRLDQKGRRSQTKRLRSERPRTGDD
ncbi:MAG: alternative ribosome rescue aminoacyl-tRNA hydrolase ArfB [Phycisphaerae bacterium]